MSEPVGRRGGRQSTVSTDDTDDDPLDLNLVFINKEWLVLFVSRLQTDSAVLLTEKFLERRFTFFKQSDDGLSVIGRGGALNDDVVTFADLLINHGVPTDAKHIDVIASARRCEEGLKVQMFTLLDGFDGEARRDGPHQGQACRAGFVGQFNIGIQLQRASLVGLPQKRSLFDQRFDVLEDRNLADAQLGGQFLHGR